MRNKRSPLSAIGLAALVSMAASPLRADPPEGWKIVFQDEFDGEDLDDAKWSTTMEFAGTHGTRYHNEYYSSYTVDEDVVIRDGLLRLRTDRRTVEGAERPGMFAYTQGLVSSHGKFDYTHGYIEICAKYPAGKGLWPCFWLMPQHQSWPPEFDIAEYYGGQRKMHHGLAHGTMHEPRWDSTGDSETDFTSGWHIYSLEWMPGRAVWSVDCIPRKIVTADYVPAVAMYVILSNSVSSRRGPSGEPDENTVFPNYFEIDYVRVYQPAPGATIEVPLVKNEPPAVAPPATVSEPPKPEPDAIPPVP